MKHHMISALALVALTACTGENLSGEMGHLDNTDFGNATMTNTLLMTGQLDPAAALASRFASEVQSTVTFDFASAQITPQSAAILSQQANWIRQFPELRFRVFGHTDEVGSTAANHALGLRRANAVVAFLGNQGISKSRLEALVSFGETRPLVMTNGPSEINRRTVTEVTGFVSNDGRTMNGKYAAVVMREYVEGATRTHPGNTEVSSELNPLTGSSN